MSDHKVDLGTSHTVFKVPKWLFRLIIYGRILIYLVSGLYISYYIFDRCLFNPNCNDVAVAFFSLIALSCFKNCGFPMKDFEQSIVTS